MQQHGGRIWAESILGAGSTFTITLPLLTEEPAEAPPAQVAPAGSLERVTSPGSGAPEGPPQPRHVVVAEDDPDLARVLMAMFERRGVVVCHAQTGTAAIQLCQELGLDLLILDLLLPEQDGYAVVDWLRQHPPPRPIPVVVYGAEEQSSAEQQRLTVGPTLFFTKSRIAPDDFAQHVLQWLDGLLLAGTRANG